MAETKSLDGKKVKVNVDKILARPISLSTRYRNFVSSMRGKVTVARNDIKHPKTHDFLYILDADENPIKWLFYYEDLILVEES